MLEKWVWKSKKLRVEIRLDQYKTASWPANSLQAVGNSVQQDLVYNSLFLMRLSKNVKI